MRVGERATVPASLRVTGAGTLLASPAGRSGLELLGRLELGDAAGIESGRLVVGDGVEVTITPPGANASVDPAALTREIEAAKANIGRLEQRLANPDFVGKAKPEVVQATRDQLQAARERLVALGGS